MSMVVSNDLKEEIVAKAIFNLPVDTEFGELKPLSIQNFMRFAQSLTIVSMGKKFILAETGRVQQESTGQSDKEIHNILKELNEYSLFQLTKELYRDNLHHYTIILRYCKFHYLDKERDKFESEEEFEKYALQTTAKYIIDLTDEQFDELREVLMILHEQTEPEAFLNPTLYRRVAKKRMRKTEKKNNSPNLTTMASSIAAYSGIPYSEIANWNSLQLQHTFQRIAMFIDSANTVLFRTVTDEVDIVEWSRNIDSDENNKNNDQELDTFMRGMDKTLK